MRRNRERVLKVGIKARGNAARQLQRDCELLGVFGTVVLRDCNFEGQRVLVPVRGIGVRLARGKSNAGTVGIMVVQVARAKVVAPVILPCRCDRER